MQRVHRCILGCMSWYALSCERQSILHAKSEGLPQGIEDDPCNLSNPFCSYLDLPCMLTGGNSDMDSPPWQITNSKACKQRKSKQREFKQKGRDTADAAIKTNLASTGTTETNVQSLSPSSNIKSVSYSTGHPGVRRGTQVHSSVGPFPSANKLTAASTRLPRPTPPLTQSHGIPSQAEHKQIQHARAGRDSAAERDTARCIGAADILGTADKRLELHALSVSASAAQSNTSAGQSKPVSIKQVVHGPQRLKRWSITSIHRLSSY